VSLFVPESVNKLHDGAVILRNYRIAKAGVFFPMPDTKVADKSLGSRHRAALGVTEETDAVVVVVSEERGTISFCFNGNIVPGLDGAQLKTALIGLFGKGARKKGKEDNEVDTERMIGRRPSAVPQSGGRTTLNTPTLGTPVPAVLRASLATPPPPHQTSVPPPPPSSSAPAPSMRPHSVRPGMVRPNARASDDSVPIVGEPQEPEVRPMEPAPESSAMLIMPSPRPPEGDH
jgi:diadenylate cyclase